MNPNDQKNVQTFDVEGLLAGLDEAADEPIGEQNADEAKTAIAKLEGILAKLKTGINAVTGKEKATLTEAREIMGKEFLGPEAAEKTFGRKLKPEEIPNIPFSKEELERARDLGQFLELRVDKAGNGKGVSMEEQNELLEKRFEKEGKGKLLFDRSWYKREEFFTKDMPKLQWALVSKEVIPGSLEMNAVVRTRVLADYVRNVVFAGQEMDAEYTEALQEFDEQESAITDLMHTTDWQECNRRLSALKLNQLCRRTPVEAIFDTETYFDNTGERLLPDKYDSTTRLSSFGALVRIGHADSAGAYVDAWRPAYAYPDVGVVFSRSR